MKVFFNKPHFTGREFDYIREALANGHVSGNGPFTRRCQAMLCERYGFKKCLLTSSCTDALEMSALLLDLIPGDEVIVPAYTFVSTANAFVLHGANVVFADSCADHPNIDPESIERSITPRTRAIVVVHYGGAGCDMGPIMEIAEKNGLIVIEDAAQAIDAYYKDRPLGSIGHLATFSFHETKNLSSGEGGALIVNDARFADRAELLWEKGTTRASFRRGEVDKYCWVDVGSSFLPSDIMAAMLCAQIEAVKDITRERREAWCRYYEGLQSFSVSTGIELPHLPRDVTDNGHIFHLVCQSQEQRDALLDHARAQMIDIVFHYLALHQSPFYTQQWGSHVALPSLPNAERFAACLIRLPMYSEITVADQNCVMEALESAPISEAAASTSLPQTVGA